MKTYFNNIECNIIAELPNNEVAINFITGSYTENDEFSSYSEPIENTIVVKKNQIQNKILTKDDVFEEKNNMLKEIQSIKNKMIAEANKSIKEEHNKLYNELKEIKKQIEQTFKSTKYCETYSKLKNNLFKYAVDKNGYICTFEDLKLKKVAYNSEEDVNFEEMHVRLQDNELIYNKSYYSDHYKLFEELGEAKKYSEDLLSKCNEFNIYMLDNIDKWGLNVENAELKREILIKKHNESIENNIKNYLTNIEQLKKGVRQYNNLNIIKGDA